MKLRHAMLVWNPAWWDGCEPGVKVGPGPDLTNWSHGFQMSAGACCCHVQRMTGDHARAYLLRYVLTLTVRDGLDIRHVHREFLKIDEYRDAMDAEVLPPEGAR